MIYKIVYYVCLIIFIIIYYIYKFKNNKKKLPYKDKIQKLQDTVKKSDKDMIRAKSNHIFGLIKVKNTNKIDLTPFCQILYLDTSNNYIELEGSCTIKQILDFIIPKGYMLPIIPDMAHLTIGGIISGMGGGSASFKYGGFHDHMIECNVILGNGEVVTCSEKENEDLFRGIPNTLGTIGYITKLKMRVIKAKSYVNTVNHKYNNFKDFKKALNKFRNDETVDFLDGTIFDSSTCICIVGKLTDEKPNKLDNFVNNKIYWKSIKEDEKHSFNLIDYIYRWDTDLYYTTINKKIPSFFKNSFIRRCIPKPCIPLIKQIVPYLGLDINIEDIVQDVFVPFEKSNEFFDWYNKNINLYPVYICPALSKDNKFSFWTNELILDFGIGYGIIPENPKEKTLSIEKKMLELKGRKLLYSLHQMSSEDFWSIYDKKKYDDLRKKYNAKFPNLFSKLKK